MPKNAKGDSQLPIVRLWSQIYAHSFIIIHPRLYSLYVTDRSLSLNQTDGGPMIHHFDQLIEKRVE